MRAQYVFGIMSILWVSFLPRWVLSDDAKIAEKSAALSTPVLPVRRLMVRTEKREIVVFGGLRSFMVDMLPCPSNDESVKLETSQASPGTGTVKFKRMPEVFPQTHRLFFPKIAEECSGERRELVVHVLNPPDWSVPRGELTIWVDSDLAELVPKEPVNLRLLAVRRNRIVAETRCSQGQSCLLTMPASFVGPVASGDQEAKLVVMPAEVMAESTDSVLTIFDDSLNRIPLDSLQIPISRVIFGGQIFESLKLDVSQNRHEISCRIPKAIASVNCESAECRMTDDGLNVFHVDPSAARIKVRFQLKEGYFRKTKAGLQSMGIEDFSLDHCAIRIPENTPLLGGQNEHRYYIKIPRDCMAHDVEQLVVETRPPTQSYVKRELQDLDQETRLLEIVFDRVPRGVDRLELTLFVRSDLLKRMGTIHIPINNNYLPQQVRLELKKIGDVGVIPNNRPAKATLLYLDPSMGDSFRLEGRPGFYRNWTSNGNTYIKGEPGSSGSVPLRLAYWPQGLAQFLGEAPSSKKGAPLAILNTEAFYELRKINVPISLVALHKRQNVVTVKCRVKNRIETITPGQFVRVDYGARDSCSIIFDRDRIPPQVGVQRLHVVAGDFNEIVSLVPQTGRLYIAVPVGERSEYDTVSVSISHDLLSGHYTLGSQQKLGETLRYRIYLSDSWIAMSVTTALPTGLFRFGPESISGSVPLSAGALGRITYIQRNGRDFPFALELGVFGTDLSGDPDFSIVTGIGLGIPVINMNTPLQASFNIHAWLEYAPTRSINDKYPIAFLFGPSFSVGRLSTTF